jgi:hypothetical protein
MKSRFPFGHAAVYAIAVTAMATPADADPYLLELDGVRGEAPDKKPPPPPPPKSRPQQGKNVQAPGNGPQEGLLLPAIQRDTGSGSGHTPPPPPPPPPPQGNQANNDLGVGRGGDIPRRGRPTVAVGDINGDGRAGQAASGHFREAKLTPRKGGSEQAGRQHAPVRVRTPR